MCVYLTIIFGVVGVLVLVFLAIDKLRSRTAVEIPLSDEEMSKAFEPEAEIPLTDEELSKA
jgi:hypothetical protein